MERERGPSLSGFGKQALEDRKRLICSLFTKRENNKELVLEHGLSVAEADLMVENVIGIYELPYSVAINFVVDGKEVLIPVVTEESSIVAGMSKAAKIFKDYGGFKTETDPPFLQGQVQIMTTSFDQDLIGEVIESNRNSIIELGNTFAPKLVARGGGVVDVAFRSFGKTRVGQMGCVDIYVNTGQAMGANLVNTICEGVSEYIENITGSRVGIKILSNLSDKRLSRSSCEIPVDSPYLFPDLAQKIVEAQVFAEHDIYRATTHNKGIFNGIDALAIATGQDFRALEAGGHAYASRSGVYKPLTNWYIENNFLKGSIELPLAVGIVGGVTKFHKTVETSFKILGLNSSQELAGIMASVGLSQNFAALLALTSKGIGASHMPLHGRKGVNA